VDFWHFLNRWWNLPYLVLLGLVAVFFAVQLLGLLDLHLEGDADADVAHEASPDGDGDGDVEGGFLSFFGVGRVPMMVIWMTFNTFCGFSGLAVNRWMFELGRGSYPGWFFPLSFLVSSVVGGLAVRLFSRLVGRLVDTGGRGSTKKHDLVGHPGVVASPVLDGRFGEIRVRDLLGIEHIVHARLGSGAAPLQRGQEVVLVAYDAEHELFEASPPLGLPERTYGG
jgi:hypothetical protein